MFKCTFLSKFADKASKVVNNLGKAKLVYLDEKNTVQTMYACVSKEEAIGLMKTAGCRLITYNNKAV